jgi:betaine-aldehyde dehydrogenase
LPAAVLNVITGYGPDAGAPIASHPLLSKVAFTGSVATGKRVYQAATESVKRVTLELGGKSPMIIFDDVDIDNTVEWMMVGIFFNQGQVCSATSRAIVHESIADRLIARFVEAAKKLRLGDGLHPETTLGPLINESQYKKVLDYIETGKREGAKLVYGGLPENADELKGYFVAPTVFTGVEEGMTIWKEEIFGPVLSVKTFSTEEEALRLANNTHFGLAAAVMSKDKERCNRVASKLEAGIVWINCSQPTFIQAPWGGKRASGIGRELGPWGLMNYLEVKQVTSYESPEPYGWFNV